MDYLLIPVVAAIGFVALSWWQGRQAERRAVRELTDKLNRSEIREYQELIGKLKTETTRQSTDFKKAKEAYDAKYRRNPSNPSDPK